MLIEFVIPSLDTNDIFLIVLESFSHQPCPLGHVICNVSACSLTPNFVYISLTKTLAPDVFTSDDALHTTYSRLLEKHVQ